MGHASDVGGDLLAFHFDFLSPYAYLAWTQIHTLAGLYGRRVVPVPTLLAALLAHGDTRGPAEIPAKRVYVFKDVVRTAQVLGVPLEPPPNHPFNPLCALRACAVDGLGDDQRKELIDALFLATWGGGDGVDGEDKVRAVADGIGLDGEAIVAAASTESAKDRLRDATGRAIGHGVFGVPTVHVDGELFFGLDAFDHLERFLAGDDPFQRGAIDAALLARWQAITPSASRPARGPTPPTSLTPE